MYTTCSQQHKHRDCANWFLMAVHFSHIITYLTVISKSQYKYWRKRKMILGYATKAHWESWGIPPFILKLCTRRRGVRATYLSLYPAGNNPCTNWRVCWVGPRFGRDGWVEKREIFCPWRKLNPGPFSPCPSHYSQALINIINIIPKRRTKNLKTELRDIFYFIGKPHTSLKSSYCGEIDKGSLQRQLRHQKRNAITLTSRKRLSKWNFVCILNRWDVWNVLKGAAVLL
jgi:hypothetical protein